MINGNELVRYFSEIEDERYYSDYEIEDLYEKAFSEGYYYAQREFGLGASVASAAILAAEQEAARLGSIYGTKGVTRAIAHNTKKGVGGLIKGNPEAVEGAKKGIRNRVNAIPRQVKRNIELAEVAEKLKRGMKSGDKIAVNKLKQEYPTQSRVVLSKTYKPRWEQINV